MSLLQQYIPPYRRKCAQKRPAAQKSTAGRESETHCRLPVGSARPLSRLRRQLSFQGSLDRVDCASPERGGVRKANGGVHKRRIGCRFSLPASADKRFSSKSRKTEEFGVLNLWFPNLRQNRRQQVKPGTVRRQQQVGAGSACPSRQRRHEFFGEFRKPKKLGTLIYGPQFRVLSSGS